MSSTGKTIYIAGAGIAGMTLGLALAKFGATVIILERNATIQEYGAGLQISPNARRVLNQLGLDKAMSAVSFEPEGIDVYPFRARRPVTTLRLGAAMRERYGAAYAVMHRGDLADTLFRACRRFGNLDIVFGVRSFDAISHARGVSISAEEADLRPRNARGFAFVGADGVNSPTRTRLLEGPQSVYRNRVAWRTLLPMDALADVLAADRTSLLFGPGYHAVCYPLPHRNVFNIALFAVEKAERAFAAHPPSRPTLPWSMLRSPQFDAIFAAAGDNWGHWPLATVHAPRWHGGNIGLIGDAAHAMLPFQAQGAAMGIEDAAILAPLLMTEPSAESAFSRYESMRRARVERVQKISVGNGRAFHMEWPFSVARNAVIGMQGPDGHFGRLDWLYGYEASPEVEQTSPRRTA